MENFNTALFLIYFKNIKFDSRGFWDMKTDSTDLGKHDIANKYSYIPNVVDSVYYGDEILNHINGHARIVEAGEKIFMDVTFEDGQSLAKFKFLQPEKYFQGGDRWVTRSTFDIVDLERIFRSNCLVNVATVRFYVIRNGFIYLIS